MMTFVVHADPRVCAQILDYRRLGKQRVEAYQIWRTLKGITKGWRNHPAVKMWEGHEDALAFYMNTMIIEWVHRGYNNTMKFLPFGGPMVPTFPWWFRWDHLHNSHKASLNRKDPSWYHFEVPDPDQQYVWPHKLKYAPELNATPRYPVSDVMEGGDQERTPQEGCEVQEDSKEEYMQVLQVPG